MAKTKHDTDTDLDATERTYFKVESIGGSETYWQLDEIFDTERDARNYTAGHDSTCCPNVIRRIVPFTQL